MVGRGHVAKASGGAMRVGVNIRLLRDPTIRGWNRYTRNLVRELAALGVDLVLYSDAEPHPTHRDHLPDVPIRVSPPVRYPRWEQWWLPRACKADAIDVVHTPFHFGLPAWGPARRVATLHDAIDRTTPLRLQTLPVHVYRWITRHRAEHIVTVSAHSKQSLVAAYALDENRVHVIPEAADPVFAQRVPDVDRERVRTAYDIQGPFVLYAGGWEARKNLPFLIDAFAEVTLPATLVLAGGTDDDGTIAASVDRAGVAERTRMLGPISDGNLAALYAAAWCFVYPSRAEGFGLQLCEAMAAGCPTLAARAASLPEVLGSGGETFGLHNTVELKALLQQVLGDDNYRLDLAERAKQRSRDFSWRRTAEETVGVYELAMGEGR